MRFQSSCLRLPLALLAGFAAFGCGDSSQDDDGHAGTGGAGTSSHDDDPHTTCGLQENCGRAEEVTLAEGLEVDGADGHLGLHVHMHHALSVDDNEWVIEIMDDGGAVADAALSVSMWSDDCGHAGPTAPEEVTTDDMGMATIHPVAAHGGPWDVILEVDAGGTTDTITIPLCIPGASHDMGDGGMLDMHAD